MVMQAQRPALLDRGLFTLQSMRVDVTRALDQIAEIHQQMAKGEVYRGYRSLPVAASGLMGLAAAWLQPASLGAADPIGFVIVLDRDRDRRGVRGLERNHLQLRRPRRRLGRGGRRGKVVGQFLPSVVGGAAIAGVLHAPERRAGAAAARDCGRSASASARSPRARICRGPAAGSRSSTTPPGSRCCGSRAARSRSRAGGSAASSASGRCWPRWSCGGTSPEPDELDQARRRYGKETSSPRRTRALRLRRARSRAPRKGASRHHDVARHAPRRARCSTSSSGCAR